MTLTFGGGRRRVLSNLGSRFFASTGEQFRVTILMMMFRRSILVAVLLVGLAGCSGAGTAERSQVDIAADVRQKLRNEIELGPIPYVITQVEFQDGSNGPWFVVQFDDPVEAIAVAGRSNADEALRGPLRLVRDAVSTFRSDIEAHDVNRLIVSLRDPRQTAFEIEPEDMWAFASGDLGEDEFLDVIKITAFNYG